MSYVGMKITLPAQEPVKNAFEEAAELRAKSAKRHQGFNTMDRKKVREIASQGGKAAAASHLKHKFTSETARAAGRKGLLARGYKV